MKIISTAAYIGLNVSSLTLITYTLAGICGPKLCIESFNDWKVLGTIGSIGAFIGAYYNSRNRY